MTFLGCYYLQPIWKLLPQAVEYVPSDDLHHISELHREHKLQTAYEHDIAALSIPVSTEHRLRPTDIPTGLLKFKVVKGRSMQELNF